MPCAQTWCLPVLRPSVARCASKGGRKMKTRFLVTACAAAAIGFVLSVSTPASALDAKACGKQWKAMSKTEKKGLKKKDYVKDCVGKSASTTPMAAPKSKSAGSATGKPGRQAMIERERACGKEWREAKAAGKIRAGQKWPQYWSECNKRLKARGM
jgi:hypothetical protein